MERGKHVVGETRSEWLVSIQAARPTSPWSAGVQSAPSRSADSASLNGHGDPAVLAAAFISLLFRFTSEYGPSSLPAFSIDFQKMFPAGQLCRLTWRLEGIEPHFGFNGDLVRFRGRAWLPDGSAVLGGRAQIIFYPASGVDPGHEVLDEEIFWSRASSG